MEPSAEQLQIARIFFPRALRAQADVATKNRRFAHYTSAEVAFSILTKGEVWMRNAQVMNDFSEIEYGMARLDTAYSGAPGKEFKALLEGMFPNICAEIENQFNGWLPHFRSETYITCVSEHLDDEDLTGRLSMWRAYGGTSGVAIVVNNTPFLGATNVLGAYSSPVEYLRQPEFDRAFSEVVASIDAARSVVSAMSREDVVANVFHMFRYAVLCTKHPGFAEEREWRVIHAPTLHGPGKVFHAYETVNGVPQSVYKIPLTDWPDDGLVGLAIPSFLNRLIIGPTQLPGTLYATFHKVLAAAGVADVEKKLGVSDIPLRR
jgi:hypothetical protein